MSRAKATDVSSPISLFPFIGVLLSTMGALLVVLVALSRSARDTAVREVAARQAAASAAGQQEAQQQFEQLHSYVGRLDEVRRAAEQRLRDDQLRLSHIEDHIRRLKDEVAAVRNSALQLIELETSHYDDRRQAEREVERLNQLIATTRQAIDALQEENKSKKRSYAVVPYEGPHGTQRRPIYVECRKDEVLLQPEGIRLTPEDFRPPLGAGNPLAAALRAVREFILREDRATALSQEAEPYPLILVRPEGILAYYRVRQAIESWDAAFGYELVENDWRLEYPPPNPLLADIVHEAIEQSRTRQQMLVAAAPRAYADRGLDEEEDFGDEELTGGGDGFGGQSGGGYEGGLNGGDGVAFAGDFGASGKGASGAADMAENHARGDANGAGETSEIAAPAIADSGPNSHGGDGSNAGGAGGSSTTGSGASGSGSPGMAAAGAPQPGTAMNVVAGTAADDASGGHGAAPPLPPGATGASLANGVGEANLAAAARAPNAVGPVSASGSQSNSGSGEPSERAPLAMQMNVQQRVPPSARGQNWAIRGKSPSAVPIRRTIHVVVRSDRIAILPEPARAPSGVAATKEIPLRGPTAAKLDDFVAAVQDRVQEWGLAGTGMYWRPVLILDADAEGQARANDLTRLLRNSGIEIRSADAAAHTVEATPHATTR